MDYSIIHFCPLPNNTSKPRCLNGSAHIKRTSNIDLVTCPMCLDPNYFLDYWVDYNNRKNVKR